MQLVKLPQLFPNPDHAIGILPAVGAQVSEDGVPSSLIAAFQHRLGPQPAREQAFTNR